MKNVHAIPDIEGFLANLTPTYIPCLLRVLSSLGAPTLGENTFIYELQDAAHLMKQGSGLIGSATDLNHRNLYGHFKETPILALLTNAKQNDVICALPVLLSICVRACTPSYASSKLWELHKYDSSLLRLLEGGEELSLDERERIKLLPPVTAMTTVESIAPVVEKFIEANSPTKREKQYMAIIRDLSSLLLDVFPDIDVGLQASNLGLSVSDQEDAQEELGAQISPIPHSQIDKEVTRGAANQHDRSILPRMNESWQSPLHGVTVLDGRIADGATRQNMGDEHGATGKLLSSIDVLGDGPMQMEVLAKTELLKAIIFAEDPYEIAKLSYSDIGVDLKKGIFTRYSPSPGDSYARSINLTDLHTETVDRFDLKIPDILLLNLVHLQRLNLINQSFSLADYCSSRSLDFEELLDTTLESLNSKWYMGGLDKDQYANQLPLFLTAMNCSLADVYWYTAKENHRSPVNGYYESSDTVGLSEILNRVVAHYFSGGMNNV